MFNDLYKIYFDQIATLQFVIMALTALIHLLFASAVARDSGKLREGGLQPVMVSGLTWAFATLLGGVFIAAVYWLIHHSKVTRN